MIERVNPASVSAHPLILEYGTISTSGYGSSGYGFIFCAT